MAHADHNTIRRHTDKGELILSLEKEEVLCLDYDLHMGQRTVRVQVIITYKDQNGVVYTADRIVKMRVKREG